MDNGIVQVTLSNPEGIVTGIQYNGLDNLLEVQNQESDRGYTCLFNFKCHSEFINDRYIALFYENFINYQCM